MTSGRIYAAIGGPLNTALAVLNPGNRAANINFFYTDSQGNDLGAGSATIGVNTLFATFLDSSTLKIYGGAAFQDTLSFTSSVPAVAVAIRSL